MIDDLLQRLVAVVVAAAVTIAAAYGPVAEQVLAEHVPAEFSNPYDTTTTTTIGEVIANDQSVPRDSRPTSATRPSSVTVDVETWRPLVGAYFPASHVDAALRVLACESHGNPGAVNPSSGASGLFQHMPRYWADRSAAAGWAGADIMDPEANVAVAAWLSNGGRDWSHWTCRP